MNQQMADNAPVKNGLAELGHLSRHVLWRTIENQRGKKTKRPFVSFAPTHFASVDNPNTWGTFQQTQVALARGDFEGYGIVLGDLKDGRWLCGIDLDTCRNKNGEIEGFAVEVIQKFATYSEISPSKTGLKIFFYVKNDDIELFKVAVQINHSKTWARGTGSIHPSAIELHLSNGYFTITNESLPDWTTDLRTATLDDLLWVFRDAGPALQGSKATVVLFPKSAVYNTKVESVPLPDNEIWSGLSEELRARVGAAASKDTTLLRRINGDFTDLNDRTHSGRDMAVGSGLKRAGFSREDMREVLLAWLPGAGAGKADDERYFTRIWDNARLSQGGDGLPTNLPSGFVRQDNGDIWFKSQHICGPLNVLCRSRSPDGNSWGKRLSWTDPDGRVKDYIMLENAISSDRRQIIEALRDGGLYIISSRQGEDALIDFLNRSGPEIREYAVTRPGWTDHPEREGAKSYVLPDRAILPPGDPLSTIRLRVSSPESLPSTSVRGDLADWKKQVGIHANGNSRLMAAMGMAFVAPLLRLLGEEGSGLHTHGKTSIGKTTALRAAASVWGPRSRIRSWRATDNGLESAAVAHNDSFLAIDEMGEGSADALSAAVYMLANGRGKSRMQRDITGRLVTVWLLTFLSTGEMSLGRKLSEDARYPRRVQGGQEARLPDLALDAGAGFGLFDRLPPDISAQALADLIRAGCANAYGTAGPAFLERLVADPDGAAQRAKKLRDIFVWLYGIEPASGQVRRVLARFGLIAAAVQLAIEWEILPWSLGDAIAGIGRCFQDWLETRPAGAGASEDATAIAQVRAFIEAHGVSRFQDVNSSRHTILNRVGYHRPSPADKLVMEFMVLPEAWKNEVCRGSDPLATAKTLARAGFLIPGDGNNLTQKVTLSDGSRPRVYVISSKIHESGDNP